MTSTSSGQAIAKAAQACLLSFDSCMHALVALGPKERALVQNQLSRFSLWTASIGVFAPGRASMDHRLRDAEDVSRLVRGLLEALDANLARCLSVIMLWASPPVTEQDEEKDTAEDLGAKFEDTLQSAGDDIKLLHQLSNTIRKAGRESQNSKAATMFEIKDEEGNNIESALKSAFLRNLRDQCPGAEDRLLERLASTMVLRRKRILYRRSRRTRYLPRAPPPVPVPPVEAPSPAPLPVIVEPPLVTVEAPQEAACDCPALPVPEQSVVESQAKTTTTLDLQRLRNPSAPSLVSGATVPWNKHDDLVFPPPPRATLLDRFRQLKAQHRAAFQEKLSNLPNYPEYARLGDQIPLEPAELEALRSQVEGLKQQLYSAIEVDREGCNAEETEVCCPYCLEALSSTKVKQHGNWREHLKNDLDPYVCLLVDCVNPEELYSHNENWLQHMKQHALRWSCHAKSHEPLTFDRKEDYESHMRDNHRNAFTDKQLAAVAERNAKVMVPLFESCPLCGATEEDDTLAGTLMEHIVGHLRFLALKSLPFIEEEEHNSNSSQSVRSDDSAKPADRSTLGDLLDQGERLEFGAPIASESMDSMNSWKDWGDTRDSGVFSAWGGLRGYIKFFCGSDPHQPVSAPPDILPRPDFPHPFDPEWEAKEAGNQLPGTSLPLFECAECGQMIPGTNSGLHSRTHGDPGPFVERAYWKRLTISGARDMQWGYVIDAVAPFEAEGNDLILQAFRGQIAAENVFGTAVLAEISRKFQDGAVLSAPNQQIFVPMDVIESVLSPDTIAAVLREAEVAEADIPRHQSRIRISAMRHFAGLVQLGRVHSITNTAREGFRADGQTPNRLMDEFPGAFWQFQAPMFHDAKYEFTLRPRCPLPFVAWDTGPTPGAFSRVYKARIHPAHMKVTPRSVSSKLPGDPCEVAVKVIDNPADGSFFAENDVMYAMRQMGNKNMIKPIAAYIYNDVHAIIFPWAEGNLEDFWMQHDDVEKRDSDDWVRWFFTQTLDICDALASLHEDRSHRIPHENLNPRNILWFKDDGDKDAPGSPGNLGALVVGDSGFGNRFRKFTAANRDLRYWAPETWSRVAASAQLEDIESESGLVLSRQSMDAIRQDTWSLGCVLLEFIVWILYGWGGVRQYRRDTSEMCESRWAVPHSSVAEWFERLQGDHRCTSLTVLGSFVGVIRRRMLIEVGGLATHRATLREVSIWLRHAYAVAQDGRGFTAPHEDIPNAISSRARPGPDPFSESPGAEHADSRVDEILLRRSRVGSPEFETEEHSSDGGLGGGTSSPPIVDLDTDSDTENLLLELERRYEAMG